MASTQATQDSIVDRLSEQGADRLEVAVASAACLAAISAALVDWPRAQQEFAPPRQRD